MMQLLQAGHDVEESEDGRCEVEIDFGFGSV